jgi:hypothetical protein
MRHILDFIAVRPLGDDSFSSLSEQIGTALGCTLHAKEERGRLSFTGAALGVTVDVYLWPQRTGPLLLVRGMVPWSTLEDARIDIGPAVRDHLNASAGLGQWRDLTQADIRESGVRGRDRCRGRFRDRAAHE